MCFAGPGPPTGDFHGDCIQGQNVVIVHQYDDRPLASTVLTTELAMLYSIFFAYRWFHV